MDKIYMNKLSFYGYHGVFPEENKLGQRFFVDLTLELDLHGAGQSDDLTKTIDYGDVYTKVQAIVEGDPYQLIEAVAERISDRLLQSFAHLQAITVKITKPDPPIKGYYESVGVEITRKRS